MPWKSANGVPLTSDVSGADHDHQTAIGTRSGSTPEEAAPRAPGGETEASIDDSRRNKPPGRCGTLSGPGKADTDTGSRLVAAPALSLHSNAQNRIAAFEVGDMTVAARTILVVEDHEDHLTIYRTILEHAGYRVLEARDGVTALTVARRERPDLILMDITLPGLDGWEATSRLKADPETEAVPIVAVTAHALDRDREKGQAVGFDAYLSKPAPPRQVLAAVRDFLGQQRVAAAGSDAPDVGDGQSRR